MAMTELEWLDTFGDNLRDLLRDARMTQRELAEETGLTEGTISKYIHKQQMPSVKALVNIYHALPCATPEDLFYFGDEVEM